MDYLHHLENCILKSWINHSKDKNFGGFFGQLGTKWEPDVTAPKGLVQHARFLWSFSAAFARTGNLEYRSMAEWARDFLEAKFYDKKKRGWYWSLNPDGTPFDRRKHVYPHSFVIYAFAEFSRAFKDKAALDVAMKTFFLLEEHAKDNQFGGYTESFSVDWQPIDQHEDMDTIGQRKSMNSHIHMLESLTTLYAALSCFQLTEPVVEERLREFINLCSTKIFNADRSSLDLFFEKDWKRLPSHTSFGHDIELSWLLSEASELIGLGARFAPVSIALATNTLKGCGLRQGLFYDGDLGGKVIDQRRIWWVQAEALIGFYNAYSLTKDEKFLAAFHSIENWVFLAQIDAEHGDWHEEISEGGKISGQKGHLWKDPYHQTRACLEVEKRLKTI